MCNKLSVSKVTQLDKAVMVYKIVNDLCLDSLKGRFLPRSHSSNYTTRNQLDLGIPRLNTEFSKNNFFYSGVKTCNDLPIANWNKFHNSLLVLQSFTTARKSGNIILTY